MIGIEHITLQYFFFDTYIGYFLEALPISLFIGIVYGIVRYRNDPNITMQYKIFSCIFVCYITGLICLVVGLDLMKIFWYWVIYHRDSGIRVQFFSGEIDLLPDLFSHINGEMIGNFLMLLPFGFLYPLSRKEVTWNRTLLVGFLTILVIEICQPLVGRSSDINDIIIGMLGVIVSASLFFVIRKTIDNRCEKRI